MSSTVHEGGEDDHTAQSILQNRENNCYQLMNCAVCTPFSMRFATKSITDVPPTVSYAKWLSVSPHTN